MSYIKTWVERCDEHPDHQSGMVSNGMIQARMQEEIDDLRAENERLSEALKPFAAEAEAYDPPEGDDAQIAWASRFTCGNLRDARNALEGKP